jgi:hypothetical protein
MMSPQRDQYSTVRLDEDPSPALDGVHQAPQPLPAPTASADYLPADSDAYRAWVSTQPRHSPLKKASLFLVVGCLVGLVAVSLTSLIDLLSFMKVKVVRAALNHKLVGVAWLFNAFFTVTLVALSAELVLRVAPHAAGSGVPEVMASLNGCKLPGVFTWRTAAVKLLSAALCVGSGLPVGPEGASPVSNAHFLPPRIDPIFLRVHPSRSNHLPGRIPRGTGVPGHGLPQPQRHCASAVAIRRALQEQQR